MEAGVNQTNYGFVWQKWDFQANNGYYTSVIVMKEFTMQLLNNLNMNVTFSEANFTQNYGFISAMFYLHGGGHLTITDSVAVQNFGMLSGFGHFEDGASFEFTNITFQSNLGIQGQLLRVSFSVITQNLIQNSSLVTWQSCVLPVNTTNYPYMASSFITILEQEFEQNGTNDTNDDFQILLSGGSTLTIKNNANISATNKLAKALDNWILIISDTLSVVSPTNILFFITDSVFSAIISLNSGSTRSVIPSGYSLFRIQDNSTLFLYNSTVQNLQGQVLFADNSKIYFENCNLDTLSSLDNEEMIEVRSGTLQFTSCTFSNLNNQVASVMTSIESDINSTSDTYSSITGQIYNLRDSNITFTSATISGISLQSNSTLYSDGLVVQGVESKIDIVSSQFSDINDAETGGVIYLNNTDNTFRFLNISKSSMNNISSRTIGGVIYVENADTYITNSTFDSNTVVDTRNGAGGAVYTTCSIQSGRMWSTVIEDSIFTNNYAYLQGGAIKYNLFAPNITNVTFSNNTAQYGPNIAAFALKLELLDGNGNIIAEGNTSRIYNTKSGDTIKTPIKVGVYDQDELIQILDDNYGFVSLASGLNSNTTQLSKNIVAQPTGGVMTFDDFIITAIPTSIVYMEASFEGIDQNKLNILGHNTEIAIVEFSVSIDDCISGEVIVNQVLWETCPAGTYSFDGTNTEWKNCMDHAICEGSDVIKVEAGYWRPYNTSEKCLRWDYPKACLGGYNSDWETGYEGNLCKSWTFNSTMKYTRINQSQCSKCPSTEKWLARKISSSIWMLILFLVIFTSVIHHASTGKSYETAIYRLMVHHMTTLMIIQSFDLNWPSLLQDGFNVLVFVFEASEEIINTKWLFETEVGESSEILRKIVVASVFPIFASLTLLLAWSTCLNCVIQYQIK